MDMKSFSMARPLLVAKLRAALLHGLVTLLVALVSAGVVFYLWYPAPLADKSGGVGLYFLLLLVEVCLGPLMSLVIFNPQKQRSELVRDYFLVGCIQLLALAYGVHSIYIARPVYQTFVVDRFEVVSALELDEEDILAATDKTYRHLPVFGLREVCIERPADAQERSDILFSAVGGKDVQLMPKYYRQCNAGEIEGKAKAGSALIEGLKARGRYEAVAGELPADNNFTWLPVKSRFGVWVEIYPGGRQAEARSVDVDPFVE
ncbi:MAG: hypothetical protein K2X80_05045 [Pseudomonadaceae bacterium]|nr:hypothetical protein [Pseudomonadaceae bacterium]